MKGDQHILSVMESKEQQKQSSVPSEKDAKHERQARELQQRELELNSRIIEVQTVERKFAGIFEAGEDWDDPTSNAALNKLVMDADGIKNLKKELLTSENKKLELRRRIAALRAKGEKLRAEQARVQEKILRKKRRFRRTRSVQAIQSELTRKIPPEKRAFGRNAPVSVEHLPELQPRVRLSALGQRK